MAAQLSGRPAWVIDLMGVDRAAQRQGIGGSLVREFIRLAEGRCQVLSVGTQVANEPSMRLYAECGFRPARAAYVLHAHLRDGEWR
jgi:GNAT superfamily N-acetyltransferase